MQINKNDYVAWLHNPVTQAFLESVVEAMDGEMRYLITEAGIDSARDRYRVGVIAGLQALPDWNPSFIGEGLDADSNGA